MTTREELRDRVSKELFEDYWMQEIVNGMPGQGSERVWLQTKHVWLSRADAAIRVTLEAVEEAVGAAITQKRQQLGTYGNGFPEEMLAGLDAIRSLMPETEDKQ